MSKVIITIEDTPKGTVKLKFDFDPPLDNKNKTTILTEAQALAFDIMDAIKNRQVDEVEDEEIFDEEEE